MRIWYSFFKKVFESSHLFSSFAFWKGSLIILSLQLFCKPFIAFLRRSLANEQILLIRKTLLYQNTIFYWYWVIWINVEECLPVDFFSAYFCTWFVVDYIQFSILERRAGQIYFRELDFSESQFYLHARSGTQKRTCKIKVNVHIWLGNN